MQSFVLLHGTDCCVRSKSHKIIMVIMFFKKAAFSPIIVCCELVKAAWWFARRLQCTEESVMSLTFSSALSVSLLQTFLNIRLTLNTELYISTMPGHMLWP